MKFLHFLFLFSISRGALGIDKEWWKHATIYEIYPKSFKDSDGDGIGDIKGVISQLDYFVDIGVDTIYMPPFYPSSNADGGYDIVDFKGIDPVYGTMEDFELLTKEMKSRGLYLLVDLVINHSSDEHEWFEKSVEKIHPYTDYYIWADPKGRDWNGKPIPPNNWFSIFSMQDPGSAWTWNEKRNQFYLHHFHEKQPDLNLRNEEVKQKIKDIMKFWMEKGVTGFRVDAPMVFIEDEQLRDNPPPSPDATIFTIFVEGFENTYNHPDTYRFLNEMNLFLRQVDKKLGKSTQTPLIGETYGSITKVRKYYGTKNFPVVHLPFNFHLTTLSRNYTNSKYRDARELRDFLQVWLEAVPKGMPSNWALGNHDIGRLVQHFNTDYSSIFLALVSMLPGAATIYYGEELSQGNNHLVRMKDAYNRFSLRTPMHWNSKRNAGFTTAEKPWLPVHPNYWKFNVEDQRSHENSSLNYFKDLTSLRKTDTNKYGDLSFHVMSEWVLAFSRTYEKSKYIVVMNLGTETQLVDSYADIPAVTTVVASSPNSGYRKGSTIQTTSNYPTSYLIRPHSVLVLIGSNTEE